ncbi:MAG: DUF945 family protein [Pseudomonadales bacterium]
MKKSAMLGVVAALDVVWTGMAWYSGHLAEVFFVQSVRNVNERLTERGESWRAIDRVELMSYERGVFSSTARYRISSPIRRPRAFQVKSGTSFSSVTRSTVRLRCSIC